MVYIILNSDKKNYLKYLFSKYKKLRQLLKYDEIDMTVVLKK